LRRRAAGRLRSRRWARSLSRDARS
jgi:hypothetical protein